MKHALLVTAAFLILLLGDIPTLNAQWEHINGTGILNITKYTSKGSKLFAAVNSAVDSGGVIVSTDTGATWTAATGLPVTKILSIHAEGTTLYAGLYDAGIYVSTDQGASWSAANAGIGGGYIYDFAGVRSVALAGTYLNGIYRSTNSGGNWTAADSGMGGVYTINAFAVNGSDVYAATSGKGVYRSTDFGISWSAVNTGLSSTYGYIDAITVNGSTIFAGSYETGIFFSTNNGASWTSASNGLPKYLSIYYPILAFATSGTKIVAGNFSQGVFVSTDSGSRWNPVNGGLTHLGVRALAVFGNYLFMGGDSTGVCRCLLSALITSVDNQAKVVPATFDLAQNYPNPFNPSTTIRYSLPKSSMVRLSIYDILGREVSVLVNEMKNVGTHEVRFDGSRLASGVYFYRMTAGGVVKTMKFSLVR
ncbi:MAG TPA: T9SS type A sorting domain-containing protein [Bacteroidota bacterium]|nr:T9SS type A sorting domain-containing protein [Bacteroidota bacterium]